MKKERLIIVAISIFCLFSLSKCQTKSVSNEKEPVILTEDTIISNEKKSTTLVNDTIIIEKKQIKKPDCIIGSWFIPHSATVNITFYENGTFHFNDFSIKTYKKEVLKGTFELNGKKIILKYNDQLQQIFNFKKGKGADNNYYITKGEEYYFVKCDNDYCDSLIRMDNAIKK